MRDSGRGRLAAAIARPALCRGGRGRDARHGQGARTARLRRQRRARRLLGSDEDGKWAGFDVDFCRAVAAAVFGDPEKVDSCRSRPASASRRCAPARSTSCRATRPGRWGARRSSASPSSASPTTTARASCCRARPNIPSALELGGSKVCVQAGTTSEANLADYLRRQQHDLRGGGHRVAGRVACQPTRTGAAT